MHHGLFVIHWWTILIIIVVNVSTNHRTTSPSLVLLDAALNSALRVRSPIWRLYLTNGVFAFSSGSGSSLKVTLMEESGGFLSHVFVIVFVYDRSGLLHCHQKGPYYRDWVLIRTFLAFWVPIGSLFIFQGPYFQCFGFIHAKNVNSVCMYTAVS